MESKKGQRSHERWAHLRFSIVGGLLSSPPPEGELQAELARLSQKEWIDPEKGKPTKFGVSTIERWYYAARDEQNPIQELYRKVRKDSGQLRAMTDDLVSAARAQFKDHPRWSVRLHLDNLAVRVEEDSKLGPLPSYSAFRRFMTKEGLRRTRQQRRWELRKEGKGAKAAKAESREIRSFECEYVSGLWHLDFHHGSLKVIHRSGDWIRPVLLGILDDRSRRICHAQWYVEETAESLVHGLTQAFCKCGLPRCLMSDNGGPMIAGETTEGLARLSILHKRILPYSAYMNAKQEVLWVQVEGRLVAMLEGQPDLTLAQLNQATQAWVEMEYQHAIHSVTKQAPVTRWLNGPSVGRDTPTLDELRLAFTVKKTRGQRQSDGTLSIDGVRFEVPSRFRHLRVLHIRYATWDLAYVWLIDAETGAVLSRLYPLDRARNAEALRGVQAPVSTSPDLAPAPTGIAPLLRKLMADYAATGLPPAYIPKEDREENE